MHRAKLMEMNENAKNNAIYFNMWMVLIFPAMVKNISPQKYLGMQKFKYVYSEMQI